jgi:hypothetical protein
MAARKPKSSTPRASASLLRKSGRRVKTAEGQTSGEAGAEILREEAERGWAAADRRQARKRRRTDRKP